MVKSSNVKSELTGDIVGVIVSGIPKQCSGEVKVWEKGAVAVLISFPNGLDTCSGIE